MEAVNLKASLKEINMRKAFIILCCLIISGSALSRQHWDRSYFDVRHNKVDNSIEIAFEFFDYNFGPDGEDGYLKDCYFAYSTDGENFHNFMRSSTTDQRHFGKWSWVNMSEKLPGAKIQFGKCYVPDAGTMWAENTDYKVELFNLDDGNKAWFNIKWDLEDKYQDIKYIRLFGIWHIADLNVNDHLLGVVFKIDKFTTSAMKTEVNIDFQQKQFNTPVIDQPEDNIIKVSKSVDAIVIQEAELGQNIQVYTTSGTLVKSVVANNNVVKINLPVNQIYIVHLGQARYKVAL